MGFGIQLLTALFGMYFLTSIIGAGFTTNAIFNSSDDGDKRTIKLSDTAVIYSKVFLILYIITSVFILFAFFKKFKASS